MHERNDTSNRDESGRRRTWSTNSSTILLILVGHKLKKKLGKLLKWVRSLNVTWRAIDPVAIPRNFTTELIKKSL